MGREPVRMALHADGGILGSKPYAASGDCIDRMSDYCRGCHYDVKAAVGDRACPFNALYWDFIACRHNRFAQNNCMPMTVRTLERMDPARLAAVCARAAAFLAAMDAGEGVMISLATRRVRVPYRAVWRTNDEVRSECVWIRPIPLKKAVVVGRPD